MADGKPLLMTLAAPLSNPLPEQIRLSDACHGGHSPGDILGCHYRRIDMDELRAVSDAMNGWHEEVKRASLRKHSGNISISAKEAAEEAMC